MKKDRTTKHMPDKRGYFGAYGGMFVPELLMPALQELEQAFTRSRSDRVFKKELNDLRSNFAARPTPLYYAGRLTEHLGGARIYLKREDCAHTGSHKINNTIGQVLLAKKMGKKRIIAETGAGQHGVATATAAALLGLECVVYMGAEDVERQKLNVFRMQMLGARVIVVRSGSQTLKDAINEAMRDWAQHIADTFYVIGSVVGPHPYPLMVRSFQSIIGEEVKRQLSRYRVAYPDLLIACVGGGSNAIGLFYPFRNDARVRMIGVEAGGLGITTHKHGAALCKGKPGILHGSYSYLLQDRDGLVYPTHSVSAGLDYPGVGPEHSFLKDSGRVEYCAVNDRAVVSAFKKLALLEGIVPALETAHAIAHLMRIAPAMSRKKTIVLCLSGRGDKDVAQLADI
ncbi:MAG: tryptophan synthase subunit beta [Elusimicrobia bacterium]|nr:tryptophan synthase subunit beta [Elusimicrobiota bacterium]MBD3412692.1 tryptophan synthase subunit beta [Elusimicrobiota bacterium]